MTITFQLNDVFRDIQRKLHEKVNSVEDLAEHREWMKSVPELLDDKKVTNRIFLKRSIINLIFSTFRKIFIRQLKNLSCSMNSITI